MEGRATPTCFSGRAGHAFPAYRTFGSMRGFSGGKNDAAIAASCEKASAGKLRKRAAASQIEEEESL